MGRKSLSFGAVCTRDATGQWFPNDVVPLFGMRDETLLVAEILNTIHVNEKESLITPIENAKGLHTIKKKKKKNLYRKIKFNIYIRTKICICLSVGIGHAHRHVLKPSSTSST